MKEGSYRLVYHTAKNCSVFLKGILSFKNYLQLVRLVYILVGDIGEQFHKNNSAAYIAYSSIALYTQCALQTLSGKIFFGSVTEVSKEDQSLLQKLLRSKLVQAKTDIEILRKDPNSPLHSVKSFEALKL